MVVSKMEITTPHGAIDGKTQTMEAKFYNLDAIISVGYRVNSKKATHFRIWATKVLKEYMQKGFVLDDDRLKLQLSSTITKILSAACCTLEDYGGDVLLAGVVYDKRVMKSDPFSSCRSSNSSPAGF